MKISEIINITGQKKRLHRDPRKRRHIHSDDLYDVDATQLNASDQEVDDEECDQCQEN